MTTTREVAQDKGIEVGGRLGLLARGTLYVIMAIIAFQVALGGGDQAEDTTGALEAVAGKPFGRWLLLALAAGFGGYALWAFSQAFFDRDREGAGPIGLGKRFGRLGSGLMYAGLAAVTITIVAGAAREGSAEEKRATALAFDLPGGRWLVAAVGVGFVLGGLWFGIKACTRKFREDLRTHLMAHAEFRGYTALGILGHLARAFVFAFVGAFLLRAAWQYDPDEAVGLDETLRTLVDETYGPYALAAVGVGLAAFGLFCFVEARYCDL